MSKDQKNNKKKNCGNCGNCGNYGNIKERDILEINLMSTPENAKTVREALQDNAFSASIAKLCTSKCPDICKINLLIVSRSHINDK